MNPGNYQFAVVADFDSVEDYLVYRDHPVHRDIIGSTCADRRPAAAVQYELDRRRGRARRGVFPPSR